MNPVRAGVASSLTAMVIFAKLLSIVFFIGDNPVYHLIPFVCIGYLSVGVIAVIGVVAIIDASAVTASAKYTYHGIIVHLTPAIHAGRVLIVAIGMQVVGSALMLAAGGESFGSATFGIGGFIALAVVTAYALV